jgi:hypothetical protein
MVHQPDAGPKGSLEEFGVGGRDGVPLERVEIGGEVAGRVEGAEVAEAMGFRLSHRRPELELPRDVEGAALVVVVETHELHQRRVALLRGWNNVLDEPLPVTYLDDVSRSRSVARDLSWHEKRTGRNGVLRAVGRQESGGQVGARAAGVFEAMGSAGCLELVPPEGAEKVAEANVAGLREGLDLRVLGRGGRNNDGERAGEFEEPCLGETT